MSKRSVKSEAKVTAKGFRLGFTFGIFLPRLCAPRRQGQSKMRAPQPNN